MLNEQIRPQVLARVIFELPAPHRLGNLLLHVLLSKLV